MKREEMIAEIKALKAAVELLKHKVRDLEYNQPINKHAESIIPCFDGRIPD